MSLTKLDDSLAQTDGFEQIVLNCTPLIDVRAPVEFEQGAFEMAVNLPLMNNEERKKVGTCYKQQGHEKAVQLGHQLVNETVRPARVAAWVQFIKENPNAMLYCFRGGLRSKISQQWLANQGIEIVRLAGGYKAFRRYLIDEMEKIANQLELGALRSFVVGGRTGAGKTQLLHQLQGAIDLEGLAHHRGSAFGGYATQQPTQINYENNLAMSLIRQLKTGVAKLIIEDESANIGSVRTPKRLFDALKSGQIILLETSIEERIDITFQEYVVDSQIQYGGLESWRSVILAAMQSIRKRLGGERHQRVVQLFHQACLLQLEQGDLTLHKKWIEILLREYYDPMYDYQIQKQAKKIAFKGNRQQVFAYLNAQE